MSKRHADGERTSRNYDQPPGRRRGVETGNGHTASTGRGKPRAADTRMQPGTYEQMPAGRRSRLRIIADVLMPRRKD